MTRHCSTCGQGFAPSAWDDRYCTAHCALKDLGEPCEGPCIQCDHERTQATIKGMQDLALDCYVAAVQDHIEAGLDPRRN